MKLIVKISFALLALYIMGCTNTPEKGHRVQDEMKQADSVDIIYYDVAGNDASFKFASFTDSSLIQTLVEDISGEPVNGKDCPKDGKIYCYSNGKLFNTIYFAFSDKQCRQLSYIRNAELHVFPMSNALLRSLQQFKQDAQLPLMKDTTLQKAE